MLKHKPIRSLGERKMNEKQLEFNRVIKDKPSLNLESESKEKHNTFDIKYRELIQRKKQDAHLLYYESKLLYLLVDHFKTSYDNASSKYKFYDLRRFPKEEIPYDSSGSPCLSGSSFTIIEDNGTSTSI